MGSRSAGARSAARTPRTVPGWPAWRALLRHFELQSAGGGLISVSLGPFTQPPSDERLTVDCGPPLDAHSAGGVVQRERRGDILLSGTVLVKRSRREQVLHQGMDRLPAWEQHRAAGRRGPGFGHLAADHVLFDAIWPDAQEGGGE
jgi:hypothetical protein